MQLAKSIIPKILNKLYRFLFTRKKGCCQAILIILLFQSPKIFAQDNSPYSRYGIGDLVPHSHVLNRGMGGISAGFSDYASINFNNPAAYSSFQGIRGTKSKKLVMGRAILDLGLNLDSRTLNEPATNKKFTASNAVFSYVQIGFPLRNNWGLSFGLKPMSRISYNIISNQRLSDPRTGSPLDSASTSYVGSGGAYKVSLGTGFAIFDRERPNGLQHKLSVGVNANYLFGSKDYSTRRSFINDSVIYYQANYQTQTNFGSLYLDAGIQFKTPISKKVSLTLGAYGSWAQSIDAKQDLLRETFTYDVNLGNVRLDSVSDITNVKGKIDLPASYTAGFVIAKAPVYNKEGGWLIGADFTMQQWDKYRYYNQVDSVQDSWMVRVGLQFNPIPKSNYFSNVSYRFGFFMGPDYVKVGNKLNQIGGSFGLGLPIRMNRQVPNQITLVNLAFEYGKRGNEQNFLNESLFRLSLGFSLSDFWFVKRKYD
jgi:hypothetical protein